MNRISRIFILLFAILLMVTTYNSAFASELTVENNSQFVDTNSIFKINISNLDHPSTYGDRIVWEDHRSGDFNSDIYFYNISTSTEIRITASQSAKSPNIYGDRIVWEDHRSRDSEIYVYNLSTYKETQVTTRGSAYNPSIYEDRIVWVDDSYGWNHSDIYMYNLTTAKETQITTSGVAESPGISGDNIVWEDYRNDIDYMVNFDIYMYDLTTSKETQITTSGSVGSPYISGDRIVWLDKHKGQNNSDINIYNISTSTENQITTSGSAGSPYISGDRIVWLDEHNGQNNSYIDIYNTSTSQKIWTKASESPESLVIHNDKIVWTDSLNPSKIYIYDISTKKEISIDVNQLFPNIIGRNGTGEIYAYINVAWNPDSEDAFNNSSFNIFGSNETYAASGSYWTKSDALAGRYTINYNPIVGYETPKSETKTLIEGDSIKFSGNYLLKKRTGDLLNFGDGYVLLVKQIDPDKKVVTLELQLDNYKINEVQAKENDTVYLYKESYSLTGDSKRSPDTIFPLNISQDADGNYVDFDFDFGKPVAVPSTSLFIKSTPEGANIFVDGLFYGQTPRKVPIVDLKTYSIQLKLEGYDNWDGKCKFDELEQQIIDEPLNQTKTANEGNSAVDHGSSGGSGGTSSSPENQSNVEAKELSQTFVASGQNARFDFPQKNTPIAYIIFYSKTTIGMTKTTVEMLKNQSTLVSGLPSSEIYKFVNIWVGNGGIVKSDNIENGVVYFKVENSWIQDKNIDKSSITLCRYNNTKWNALPTDYVGEDNTYMYFTAKTTEFSSFAIAGKMATIEPVNKTKSNDVKEQNISSIEQSKKAPDFLGFSTLIALLCGYLIFRKII